MLSQLEGYQLVGFSDRDRSVLEDVRPGLKRYESNEALLRDPEVDTVLIAANNNQHHDLVVQARQGPASTSSAKSRWPWTWRSWTIWTGCAPSAA